MTQRRRFALLKQPFALDALGDVTVTSPVLNQVLVYNGTVWVNSALAHSATTGLNADDHPQYAQIAATESISGTWTWTVPVVFATGTAALPAIGFAGDTTTGINVAAAAPSRLSISLGGVEYVRFNTTSLVSYAGQFLLQHPSKTASIRTLANDEDLAVVFGATYSGASNPIIRGYGGTHASTPGVINITTPLTGNLVTFSNTIDGAMFRVGGTAQAAVYRSAGWRTVIDATTAQSFAGAMTFNGGIILGTDQTVTFDEHATAPATPSAGTVVLYGKQDGLLYSKDDAGTETLVSGGAAVAVNFNSILTAGGEVLVDDSGNVLTE